MDPFRIGLRCFVAYVILLLLLRIAGKRTVSQGSAFDFVLALVIGDLIDDTIWAEVPVAQFVVASASLLLMKLLMTQHWLPRQGH